MSEVYQPDHALAGVEELTSQHRDKELIRAFVTGLGHTLQRLEDDVLALRTERLLDSAIGVQLDYYGRLVGQSRDGDLDDDYRVAIQGRALVNSCTGKPDELLGILQVAPDCVERHYTPLAPGYLLTLRCEAFLTTTLRSRLREFLTLASPSGKPFEVVEMHPTTPFRFDTAGSGFDAGILGRVL